MYDTTKPYTKDILKLVRQTWKDNEVLPSSTDGIGTKGIYHWQRRTFRNATLDALAMNLNDMVVIRAKANELHDHIMIPEEDREAIIEILDTLVYECRKRNMAISSGETSIHDNLEGLEISVTVTGEYVERRENKFEEGDHLIGIGSNGLHSNGFTMVRKLFEGEYKPEFVEPTFIYADAILDLIERIDINGMIHITGGAYTKLRPLLHNTDAVINNKHELVPHEIFRELYERGVSDKEMYNTFNCGVGFVLSAKDELEKIISNLKNFGFDAKAIGMIVPGTGKVKINSMFSQEEIVL